MSGVERLDPLPDDLAELLDVERSAVSAVAPASAKARVLSRLSNSLALDFGDLGAGEDSAPSADADVSSGALSSVAEAGVSSVASSAASSVATVGATAKLVVGVGLASFVAGGGLGAVVHREMSLRPEPAQVIVAAPPARPPEPVLMPAPKALEPQPALLPNKPPAPSKAPPVVAESPPAPTVDRALAQERALVERGRSASARGRVEEALQALDEHRARFEKGRLGEEREALAIQAFASSGRFEEARQRASAFKASYPNSLLAPVVDAALKSVGP